MNGNLPSASYNNNGSINNISVIARPSSVSGKQFGDCISDDLGAPMNTFVGFNLKRLESNDDEGFMLQENLVRGGRNVSGDHFHGLGFQRGCSDDSEERWIRKVLVRLSAGDSSLPLLALCRKRRLKPCSELHRCALCLLHMIQLQSRIILMVFFVWMSWISWGMVCDNFGRSVRMMQVCQ
jgi:hypothetical protein